jgi:methanogenic corrinoid protein MtbC1
LEVIDLGVDVPAEKFVEAAIENNADIIACSALLTTTMTEMKNIVEKVKASSIGDKVKIMIGGAPVTDNFRASIGADVYTADAASAAEEALAICLA